MQKTMLVVLILTTATASVWTQQKRIFNNGEVDFAPAAARFELSADEFESNLKEIQYSINGGEISVYTGPIQLTNEGRNVVTYRAIDATGNVSPEKAYTVVIDTTPPELTGTARGNAYVADGEAFVRSDTAIMLDATDELSGVWNIYVSTDGENYFRFGDVAYVEEEGRHQAYAYAVDNVGNRSGTFRVTGNVDNTGPQVGIVPRSPLSVVQGKRFTSAGNSFVVRASDAVAGVEEVQVSIDGGEFVTYGGPVSFREAGDHTISARAFDKLGNESRTVELAFTVDIETPQPQIRAIIGN